jgi:hypothetical protein
MFRTVPAVTVALRFKRARFPVLRSWRAALSNSAPFTKLLDVIQDAIGSFGTLLFSFISSQQAQVVLGLSSRLTHRFSMHRPDE